MAKDERQTRAQAFLHTNHAKRALSSTALQCNIFEAGKCVVRAAQVDTRGPVPVDVQICTASSCTGICAGACKGEKMKKKTTINVLVYCTARLVLEQQTAIKKNTCGK